MRIETGKFKRTHTADWEKCVVVNEGDGPIIDEKGLVLKRGQVYDWRSTGQSVMTVFEEIDARCKHCKTMLHGICKECGRHCSCYEGVKKGSARYKRGLI
jgi:hypothetical protein